jgi:phosphoglycerate dehydrogenase-like enzyme
MTEKDVRRLLPPDAPADVVVVDPRTERAAADAVGLADIVLGDYLFEVPITRRVIDEMRHCRLIQQPSVGYQQIDVDAATERHIAVANVAGANDVAVAEHTVMAGMALMRELLLVDREIRAGGWPQLTRSHFELAGKTWGIVGFGRIGRQVARRLHGWDAEVIYHDAVRADPAVEAALGVAFAGLDELVERSDVISVHVPLTESTRHLLDARRIARMKSSAHLVNVARGEVVDETALLSALRSGAIRGAALDVFEREPLPAGHPFTGLDNVILTPHTAGTVREALIRVMKMTAANVQRAMRGEEPIDLVNGPG